MPYVTANTAKNWKSKSPGGRTGIDALFDSGLITFDTDGTIKISPKIDPENQERLGISPDMQLKIEPESEKYFEYHRNHVFQKEE